MDLLLRDLHPREQGLAGEALVRVLVLGRDEALVTPPDVPGAPVKIGVGEPFVYGSRSRAAGEGDAKRVRRAGAFGDPGRRALG
jgi:hypothetical protein